MTSHLHGIRLSSPYARFGSPADARKRIENLGGVAFMDGDLFCVVEPADADRLIAADHEPVRIPKPRFANWPIESLTRHRRGAELYADADEVASIDAELDRRGLVANRSAA